MEVIKSYAAMFYDKDNQLIVSFGLENYPEEDKIESYLDSMMMDGLSVDEYEKVAYAKIETHYLIIK